MSSPPIRESAKRDSGRKSANGEDNKGGPSQNRSEGGGGSVGMMANELELAKYTIFDPEALGATNFKLFPGSSREITPAAVAEQVNKSIAEILAGNYDLLEDGDLE